MSYGFVIGQDYKSVAHDGTMIETKNWVSLETFIEYGSEWKLTMPVIGLKLDITSVVNDQDFVSCVATPAFWEGQVLT